MSVTVLVTGASGFVGSHLAQALVEAGHTVRAMTRHPGVLLRCRRAGRGRCHAMRTAWQRALDGVDAAYYLVHSLDDDDFERKDADGGADLRGGGRPRPGWNGSSTSVASAERTRSCPRTCGPGARWKRLLAAGPVPVTVLRAAIVIGHGGISWEITRQLVAHLPAMIVPRWATTKTQPIALRDVIRYLVGVLEPVEARGRTFEIGGPEVLTYAEMMQPGRPPAPRSAAADAGGAPADPAAVVVLACPRHRRGHRDRAQPGRLDEQRGDRGTTPRSSMSCPAGRWATTKPCGRRSTSAMRRLPKAKSGAP